MPYYDDRDYFYSAENIDDLYDDDMIFEEEASDEDDLRNTWEYDYHNLTEELIDD